MQAPLRPQRSTRSPTSTLPLPVAVATSWTCVTSCRARAIPATSLATSGATCTSRRSVNVSSSGGFSSGNYSAADQKLILQGVDLTTLGGDTQIIQNLLANGKLNTD
jgi:hypothetical protein